MDYMRATPHTAVLSAVAPLRSSTNPCQQIFSWSLSVSAGLPVRKTGTFGSQSKRGGDISRTGGGILAAQICWPPRCGGSAPSRRRRRTILRAVHGENNHPDGLIPLRDLLAEEGIYLESYYAGQQRRQCPRCGGGSTKEKCLAVKVEDAAATWLCHRSSCGWSGGVNERKRGGRSSSDAFGGAPRSAGRTVALTPSGKVREAKKYVRPSTELSRLGSAGLDFFKDRKISQATLDRNRVGQAHEYAPALGERVWAIAFPYMRNGELVNIKYRGPNKLFWQEKGAEKILYGLDDIREGGDVIIVEGEMDKLALEEAGFTRVVSVPDGAPAAVKDGNLPLPGSDTKYEYLWNCREYLDKAQRIFLATDSDKPGQALAEEIARRLGRERCWRVRWVVDGDSEGVDDDVTLKDANEVLMERGADSVRACIQAAEPLPIAGLFRFSDYTKEIDQYYYCDFGDERGVSSGWSDLDPHYRIVPGELTIVTGVPNSGKSEWIDALIVNLSENERWRFCLCSMENQVRDHARKLLEKHVKKPFFDAPYGDGMPRMTREEMKRGQQWLDRNFFLIRCENDELPSVEWVLDIAKAAVLRHGIRGLVIDPYNELDHQRPSNMTETEYVSQMLTKIKRFAQHHDCHVWFVAHPKQLQNWKGEAPGLYDISGSAHFVNKADNGIVVHRNSNADTGPLDQVNILIRKVRNKAAGKIGESILRYDRITGRYEMVDKF